jgi:hypothetical protein
MKYKCKTCKSVYTHADDAAYCCNGHIQMCVYLCPVCKATYETYGEADECCFEDKVEEVEE